VNFLFGGGGGFGAIGGISGALYDCPADNLEVVSFELGGYYSEGLGYSFSGTLSGDNLQNLGVQGGVALPTIGGGFGAYVGIGYSKNIISIDIKNTLQVIKSAYNGTGNYLQNIWLGFQTTFTKMATEKRSIGIK